MANVKKFSETDLYKLIGVEFTATEQEVIRKLYFQHCISNVLNENFFRFESHIARKP